MSGPEIAGWVRQRRAELGMTRSDVVLEAARQGHKISQSTVQAIEDGERASLQPRIVEALAAGLKTTAETIRGVLDGRPEPVSDDAQVGSMLDWLTPDQQRTVLSAVRRWLHNHPEHGTLDEAGVVEAIDRDPVLSDENRRVLRLMYRTMTGSTEPAVH